jgi:hypothetical protein
MCYVLLYWESCFYDPTRLWDGILPLWVFLVRLVAMRPLPGFWVAILCPYLWVMRAQKAEMSYEDEHMKGW